VRSNRLDRYYDLFDPVERFGLAVAAQARDDESELERLYRTCPRRRYCLPDPAFADRFEFAREVVIVAMVDLLPVLAKLRVLEALTTPVRPEASPSGVAAFYFEQAIDAAAFAAIQALAVDEEEREDELFEQVAAAAEPARQRFLTLLDELERELQRNAASQLEGFGRFCRAELELDPLLLFRAFALPFVAEVEPLLELDVDDELARSYAETLSTVWRRRLRLPDRTPPAGDGAGS
jgi:hypothetical protein